MKTKIRHAIQFASAVFINGYYAGFKNGSIFRGKTKMACIPVLNCYSCPGALSACPIGALQSVLGDSGNQFSFYVIGFLMLFGILCGRLICGFLCPFGFIQELLNKIKLPKLKIKPAIDKPLRYIKYAVLLLFVIVGPMYLTNFFGMGSPYFCKLICPAGTLEGGLPLVFSNPILKKTIGNLFFWKISLLVVTVLSSIFIYRPFCKYLCPLGAIYGMANHFSCYQIEVDRNKCITCGKCEKECKMGVRIIDNKLMSECIRCGKCKSVCPENAIKSSFFGHTLHNKNSSKIF